MTAISMRELQKLSADKIRNLPHAVEITSGGETVGLISPVRRPDPVRLRAALQRLDDVSLELTREELDRIEAVVGKLDLE